MKKPVFLSLTMLSVLSLISCGGTTTQSSSSSSNSSDDSTSSSSTSQTGRKYSIVVVNGTGSGKYYAGDTVTAVATVTDGKAFAQWEDENGTVLSTDATYSFVVSGAITIIARMQDNDFSMGLAYVDGTAGQKGGSWLNLKDGKVKTPVASSSSDHSYYLSIGATADSEGKSLYPSYTTGGDWDGVNDVKIGTKVTFDAKDLTKKVLNFDVSFSNMAKGVGVEFLGASGALASSVWTSIDGFSTDGKTYVGGVNAATGNEGWYSYSVDIPTYVGQNVTAVTGIALYFINSLSSSTDIDNTKEHLAYVDNMLLTDRGEDKTLTLVNGTFADSGLSTKTALNGSKWKIVADAGFGDRFGGWYEDGTLELDNATDYATIGSYETLTGVFTEDGDYSNNVGPQSYVNNWANDGNDAKTIDVDCSIRLGSSADTYMSTTGQSMTTYAKETQSKPYGIWEAAPWKTKFATNVITLDVKMTNLAPCIGLLVYAPNFKNTGVNVTTPLVNYKELTDAKDGTTSNAIKAFVKTTTLKDGWTRITLDPFSYYTYGLDTSSTEYQKYFEDFSKNTDTIRLRFTTGGEADSAYYTTDWDNTKENVLCLDNCFSIPRQ